MSYNKTNWNTGDTITAEKLNNMENGIENTIQTSVVYLKFAQEYDEVNHTNTYTLYEASMTPEEYYSMLDMGKRPLALVSIGEVIEPEVEGDEPYFSEYITFLASLSSNGIQNFVTNETLANIPTSLNLYTIVPGDTWTLMYKYIEFDS